jgi:hypothetical protein
MEYLVVGIAGLVGGRLGYPNPDDDDSPDCDVCGLVIGVIAAIIYYLVLKNTLGEDNSFFTLSVVGLVGGAAGAALGGAGINMARGKKTSS